jgi:hypothetical protein
LQQKDLILGHSMSMHTCWELAQLWYRGRMERDWMRLDIDRTQALFTSLGLTGKFWDLD